MTDSPIVDLLNKQEKKPVLGDITINTSDFLRGKESGVVLGAFDATSQRQMIVKIYEEELSIPSKVKNLSILRAFEAFQGKAPSLVRFVEEGLGMSLSYKVDGKMLESKSDAEAIIETRVEGDPLYRRIESMSLEQVQKAMKNVFDQLRFVASLDERLSGEITKINETIEHPITIGYHGDISDTALIIYPETGIGSLVDWEHSLNEGISELEVHPIYSSPEAWRGEATDAGLEAHYTDVYALGGVLARMLLGEKDFYACMVVKRDMKEDRPMGHPGANRVKKKLTERGVPSDVAIMIHTMLSYNNPKSRLISNSKTPIENYNSIEKILMEQ